MSIDIGTGQPGGLEPGDLIDTADARYQNDPAFASLVDGIYGLLWRDESAGDAWSLNALLMAAAHAYTRRMRRRGDE